MLRSVLSAELSSPAPFVSVHTKCFTRDSKDYQLIQKSMLTVIRDVDTGLFLACRTFCYPLRYPETFAISNDGTGCLYISREILYFAQIGTSEKAVQKVPANALVAISPSCRWGIVHFTKQTGFTRMGLLYTGVVQVYDLADFKNYTMDTCPADPIALRVIDDENYMYINKRTYTTEEQICVHIRNFRKSYSSVLINLQPFHFLVDNTLSDFRIISDNVIEFTRKNGLMVRSCINDEPPPQWSAATHYVYCQINPKFQTLVLQLYTLFNVQDNPCLVAKIQLHNFFHGECDHRYHGKHRIRFWDMFK